MATIVVATAIGGLFCRGFCCLFQYRLAEPVAPPHPTNNPTRTLRCQQALHHDGRRHTVGTRRRVGSVLDESDQSGRNSTRLRMSSGFMRDAIRARSWIAPPMVIRN